jgi:hypothetical protein
MDKKTGCCCELRAVAVAAGALYITLLLGSLEEKPLIFGDESHRMKGVGEEGNPATLQLPWEGGHVWTSGEGCE